MSLDELQNGFESLKIRFPHLFENDILDQLSFKKNDSNIRSLKIEKKADTYSILYSAKVDAYRAFGKIVSGLVENSYSEETTLELNGIMLDVSRNAVLTVDGVKKFIDQMAIVGLNMLILYTEDTYEIEEEPLFGYKRGAYSKEELQELDRYSHQFGIEMFPCIQTLGHLEQILQWQHFGPLVDSERVLLAGEEKSYELIEKMIVSSKDAYTSKRIHIGMDEAMGVGLGRYYKKHGYHKPFDVLSDHLKKVVEICKKYNLKPMMWSDMYFRLGSKNSDYYDLEADIPQEIKESVKNNAQLVYWDYYNKDIEFYKTFIDKHFEMDRQTMMATGIWTWGRFWVQSQLTKSTITPCLNACREKGVKEVFATMWGDDGAECILESCLPSLIYYADLCFSSKVNEDDCKKSFEKIYQASWDGFELAGLIDAIPEAGVANDSTSNVSKRLLWTDALLSPLEGDKDIALNDHFKKLTESLEAVDTDKGMNHYLNIPKQIAKILSQKSDLHATMRKAYSAGDKKLLKELASNVIPVIMSDIESLWELHREYWYSHLKPFGFEVVEVRYGGAVFRLKTLIKRLNDFINDDVQLEELEGELISVYKSKLANAVTYKRALTSSKLT